jgi:hypothetical protein
MPTLTHETAGATMDLSHAIVDGYKANCFGINAEYFKNGLNAREENTMRVCSGCSVKSCTFLQLLAVIELPQN